MALLVREGGLSVEARPEAPAAGPGGEVGRPRPGELGMRLVMLPVRGAGPAGELAPRPLPAVVALAARPTGDSGPDEVGEGMRLVVLLGRPASDGRAVLGLVVVLGARPAMPLELRPKEEPRGVTLGASFFGGSAAAFLDASIATRGSADRGLLAAESARSFDELPELLPPTDPRLPRSDTAALDCRPNLQQQGGQAGGRAGRHGKFQVSIWGSVASRARLLSWEARWMGPQMQGRRGRSLGQL